MLKKYSLKALQKALNHALKLDPTAASKLEKFSSKVLKIIITPLEVSFFILFNRNEIKLLATYPEAPNTTIYSSPLGLIRLSLLPASQARSLFNERIKISGDIEFGQQIKKFFDDVEIDWEGHLAQFTGDVVAYQVGSLVRQGLSFTKQLQQSLRLNTTEYLQEELYICPSREEVEDFFNDIDSISQDVERLAAKIKLLLSHEK